MHTLGIGLGLPLLGVPRWHRAALLLGIHFLVFLLSVVGVVIAAQAIAVQLHVLRQLEILGRILYTMNISLL